MGRKQNRGRQHLLFLVAGLIFFLLGGCASLKEFLEDFSHKSSLTEERTTLSEARSGDQKEKKEAPTRLDLSEAHRLFQRGEYEAAFREYQKAVVLLKKRPPADEALFFMGIIQAYPENPRKDIRRSIELMSSVITDFPQSLFLEPAKAWIGVLMKNEQLGKTNEKSVQEKETLAKEMDKLLKAHEKLVKDYEKMVRENERLNKMLEEYKQVDIEMEGKKREKGR
jgi:hypothetical protein